MFFSGAAGGQFDSRARLAPLKNKKKDGDGRAGAINRPPLTGFESARRGREWWPDLWWAGADSLDFQGIAQFMIRLTEFSRLPGREHDSRQNPTLKRWAIVGMSLRDKSRLSVRKALALETLQPCVGTVTGDVKD